MNATIICIGDELLIGQTINTNAAVIGEALSANQVKVHKSVVVGDEEAPILEEFASAWNSSNIVFVTGGLGPTHDDITRTVITKFFNTELIENEIVLQDIKDRFQSLNRVMVKINEEQALVPAVAEAIRNSRGTAPGFWIEKDGKIFIATPGVPFEMRTMLESFIIPRIQKLTEFNDSYTSQKTLLTTGIPESTLFFKLGNLDALLEGAKLAFLPSPMGVKMRVTVTEANRNDAESKLTGIEQKIRAIAGKYIYGTGTDDLAQVVGKLLAERNLTIAIAESCTGGHISDRITDFGGSSNYFERGVISYSNAAKVEILKVDEDALAEHGAVSYEVARQMAAGIKSISGTDIGLSITGILGPGGGSEAKPVGTVFIGFCDSSVCSSIKLQFGNDRIINKERAAQAALNYLRKSILGISPDE
ncbi:MAG: competence/damage-inducible protein A [Ignavibacteria bacterium]|nr:competence/damage-inducible protein A [Ignavibacteria bacterium]